MWKRYLAVCLVAVPCSSAGSDGAAPGSPVAEIARVATDRSAVIPTEARRAAELETAFADDAIVRIGDGDDRAIGVFRDAIDDDAIGVVVVVLGTGLTHDAHVESISLRRSLPRGRWATLTVALPDEPNENLPPRQRDKVVEGATAVSPDAAALNSVGSGLRSGSVDPMSARVRARLDEAVKAARAKRSNVVVLGEGAAGAWVVWAVNQGLSADAVIAINTTRGSPRIDDKRPKDTLAILKTPTLMLIESPLDWSVDDRLAPNVELRLLPPGQPSGARLDRQIRGWLNGRFEASVPL